MFTFSGGDVGKKGKGFVGGWTEKAGGMYYSFRPCIQNPSKAQTLGEEGGERDT